jgi:hypothetical protein
MYSCTLSLIWELDGLEWSKTRPIRFTPGTYPVPLVCEAGWASEPAWKVAENLAPAGIRSPDRPVRSESLYRLSYAGQPYLSGRTHILHYAAV